MGFAWRTLSVFVYVAIALGVSGANATIFFQTDFSSGIPSDFGGEGDFITGATFNGINLGGGVFEGGFLHNQDGANQATTLSLSGLPEHTSIDLGFLFGAFRTWDGSSGGCCNPDFFNVRLDGELIFSETFSNFKPDKSDTYSGPSGVSYFESLYDSIGITETTIDNQFQDARVYDLGFDSRFQNLSHSADTLTIEWFANGGGYQGGFDESFGLDNVSVTLNGTTVSEPSTLVLLGIGFAGLCYVKQRKRYATRRKN